MIREQENEFPQDCEGESFVKGITMLVIIVCLFVYFI